LGLPADQEALVLSGNILRLLKTARVGRSALVKNRPNQNRKRAALDTRNETSEAGSEFHSERSKLEAEYRL
jgi:hypothetical protein